ADSLAMATLAASSTIARADAQADCMTALVPIETQYRIKTAQIERQYQIERADAMRDPSTQMMNLNAAVDRQVTGLSNLRKQFTSDEQSLAFTLATRMASDQYATAAAIAGAA